MDSLGQIFAGISGIRDFFNIKADISTKTPVHQAG